MTYVIRTLECIVVSRSCMRYIRLVVVLDKVEYAMI